MEQNCSNKLTFMNFLGYMQCMLTYFYAKYYMQLFTFMIYTAKLFHQVLKKGRNEKVFITHMMCSAYFSADF